MRPPLAIPDDGHQASPLRAPVHEGRPKGDRQRQLLMALIAANPGVHILRAAALLGLNWNTCLHHVRRLEGSGEVTVRKINGRVCLFDRRSGASAARVGNLLLRDERNARLAKILIECPGVNQKSLAGRLGVAASVVHYRLVRLEEAGLIQRVDHGREVCVFPTESLESAYRSGLAGGALLPSQGLVPSPEPGLASGLSAPGLPAPDLVASDPEAVAAAELPTPFDVDAPQAAP